MKQIGFGGVVTNAVKLAYKAGARSSLLRPILIGDYERRFAQNEVQNLFRGVFSSFAEATASAPRTRPTGYDNPDAAKMYRDRVERVYTNDYPLLFWLSRVLPAAGRVFDFGGHIGLARYSFDRYLRFPEALLWEVCDVPAVVEEGRRFAASMHVSNLRFTTERSAADGADVLFSSGALQYLEEGPAELLRPLQAPPKHVLLNLLPVHPSRRSITLQSIGTAYCPYQIFEERSLVQSFEQLGYQLVDRWDNPDKACEIPFHADASVKGYTGFFFSKERGLASAAQPLK